MHAFLGVELDREDVRHQFALDFLERELAEHPCKRVYAHLGLGSGFFCKC